MTAQKPLQDRKPIGRRPWRVFSPKETAEMVRLWLEGSSQTAIARKFSTCQSVVSRTLRKEGVELENRSGARRGASSHLWKGGRITTEGGYVAVLVPPRHPLSSMRNRTGYVLEHRLVMAEKIGRPLGSRETVHHINGNRKDNRPENLELWSSRHPKGTRVADRVLDTYVGPGFMEVGVW